MGLFEEPSLYVCTDTWRAPDFRCCCHSKMVFARTCRCIRNCITLPARAWYFLLLWRAVSLLCLKFRLNYSYFGALARYTNHRLWQRASSPTNTISCPLRPVPFSAAADKAKAAFRSSLCIPSFACLIFLHSFDDSASLSSQAVSSCWWSTSWSTL